MTLHSSISEFGIQNNGWIDWTFTDLTGPTMYKNIGSVSTRYFDEQKSAEMQEEQSLEKEQGSYSCWFKSSYVS